MTFIYFNPHSLSTVNITRDSAGDYQESVSAGYCIRRYSRLVDACGYIGFLLTYYLSNIARCRKEEQDISESGRPYLSSNYLQAKGQKKG